jgi:RNA polymerase sigma-70 factor (ECF subfamily)
MDDLEFVRKCCRGDKLAWDDFVEKYSRLIYHYIYQVLYVRGILSPQGHATDIFQEIICALLRDNFKKLKTFQAKNGCSLASWLRQVAINATIDSLRKSRPAISLEAESDTDLPLKETLADNAPAASEALAEKEKLKGLKDCIKKLDKDDKILIELHINRGLRLQDLKNYFKVSRGAIDMRKSRLVSQLRECFKSKGFMLDS